ncbi:serine protease [Microvirga sp. W0021]|uniref:Serine protease n=1 Tax=Hohaiivirga grylli TaxID=3133970 RepID=A0ABV0BGA3_9HYPH
MHRLSVILLSFFILLIVVPLQAQNSDRNFAAAKEYYDDAPEELKSITQSLLLASGYRRGLTMTEFTPELYKAIRAYQADNGLKVSGVIDSSFLNKLLDTGIDYLKKWDFKEIQHPMAEARLVIPFGLGLSTQRDRKYLYYKNKKNDFVITFTREDNTTLKFYFDFLNTTNKQQKNKILISNMKSDHLMFSALHKKDIFQYVFFIKDRTGITGFHIYMQDSLGKADLERLMAIMSSSLYSSIERRDPTGPYFTLAAYQALFERLDAEQQQSKSAKKPKQKEEKTEKASFSSGTGFFVDDKGHLLTNAHVVDSCRNFVVTADQIHDARARLIAKDDRNDLALLKIEEKPSTVAVFRTNVKLGEPIAVFGYPLTSVLSTNGNFTVGNITALSGMANDSRHLQISAPVQPGNSGGPLLDSRGNIVGVIVSKLNALSIAEAVGDIPQNINFAIRASVATSFLSSNNIRYSDTPRTGSIMDSVTLAEHARLSSAFILCR